MYDSPHQNPDVNFEDLRFLMTLWQTRSLTTSAARHTLSMGAASRRLNHAREIFKDELFVRSGLVMLPTQRMRELFPKIQSVLTITKTLFQQEYLDLTRIEREVRVMTLDHGVIPLLEGAIKHFYDAAPKARMSIIAPDDHFFDRLRAGSADIAIYPMREAPKDFHLLELYRTRRGILVRDNHPLVEIVERNGALTLADLAEFRKVQNAFQGSPDWVEPSSEEAALEAVQAIGFSVPFFMAVPYVVHQTDFTYTAPVVTLQNFMGLANLKLRILPAPNEIAFHVPALIWHHGTHHDPFLQWVRGVIINGYRTAALKLDTNAQRLAVKLT